MAMGLQVARFSKLFVVVLGLFHNIRPYARATSTAQPLHVWGWHCHLPFSLASAWNQAPWLNLQAAWQEWRSKYLEQV